MVLSKITKNDRDARLIHVANCMDSVDTEKCVAILESGTGNSESAAFDLSIHAMACGILSWFRNQDLKMLKQWFYVASLLDKLKYSLQLDTHGPGAKTFQLLKPLVAEDESLLQWFLCAEGFFKPERIQNTKTHDFWAYQAFVAARGDFEQLEERCKRVFQYPPKSSKDQKYLADHNFFSALAKGDFLRMESALADISQPKKLQYRVNDENGLTDYLVFTPAVIYAKIAWRHGYRVNVETPFIPKEWLPIAPLEKYNLHYNFFP